MIGLIRGGSLMARGYDDPSSKRLATAPGHVNGAG